MTSNVFKPGDLIFLIDRIGYVRLVNYVTNYGSKTVETVDIETDNDYLGYGFAATPENREALVTLYSEETVPKLPLRGSDLTRKLLEKHKYVMCWVSNASDEQAREAKELIVINYKHYDPKCFECIRGHQYRYAIPIDMDGNEITEIEE